MIDASDITDGIAVCGSCNRPLRKSGYVQSLGLSMHMFCSEPCFRAALREQRAKRWASRRRLARRLVIGISFVAVCLAPHQGPRWIHRAKAVPTVEVLPPDADLGPPMLPAGWFGPTWPPTEGSVLAALGQDAWVHPLAGPIRRMPRTDARVFGALRPGNRAVECRNGHCGVDLGGEIWGEHVRAVHDGVVEYVQRGPNSEHGGRFVRVAHRNGTVITQYFHLAAIPRGIERGTRVKSGDVLGLLGDSGVKESAPHLHFSISIRPAKDRPEKYMDPEPLIALWPLRVPVDGSEVGLVTTVSRPGVPLGSMPFRPGAKRKAGKQKRAVDDPGRGSEVQSESREESTGESEPSEGPGDD